MIEFSKEKPVSIQDVADLFKVHRATVEAWIKRGMESVKIGHRVYTSLDAVTRWGIHNSTVETPTTHDTKQDLKALRKLGVKV
jgi:predicted DNA-binding protein YlxM (UPF0122 family)